MDDAQSKVCTKCGELKTLGEYANKKGGKYGKASACKDCECERGKVNYKNFLQKVNFEHPTDGVQMCNKCNFEKALSEFAKNKLGKQGRHLICRSCKAEQARNSRLENKDALLEKERAYREGRRDELREYEAAWRSKNKDKIREYDESFRERHKDDHASRLKFNFLRYMRANIEETCNRTWEDLLDFTVEQLMDRLESMFKSGMSWENYGEWHVDHVLPITYFNIKTVSDGAFKECWSLLNLQPLWAIENAKKGTKVMVEK